MGGRALVAGEGGARLVGDVALVVGRVEALSVPAGREDDGHADAARAGLAGELGRVGAVAGGAVAAHYALGFGEAAVAVYEGAGAFGSAGGVAG